MIKNTGEDYARQVINPLTKEGFIAEYGNGTSNEQGKLGRGYARVAAEYSAGNLDGSILNMRLTTIRLVEALKPLNDYDFALGFNEYLFRVNHYFKNDKLEPLLNSMSSAVVDIDRPCVTQFLTQRGYQYTPVKKPKM